MHKLDSMEMKENKIIKRNYKRLEELSKPYDRNITYPYNTSLYDEWNSGVKRSALTGSIPSRINQLAIPTKRYLIEKKYKDPFKVRSYITALGPFIGPFPSRINKLGTPNPRYLIKEPRVSKVFEVKRHALVAKLTRRIKNLSKPRKRINENIHSRNSAFNVQIKALHYHPTNRIKQLARPRQYYVQARI